MDLWCYVSWFVKHGRKQIRAWGKFYSHKFYGSLFGTYLKKLYNSSGNKQNRWPTWEKRSSFGGSWSCLAWASSRTYSRCMFWDRMVIYMYILTMWSFFDFSIEDKRSSCVNDYLVRPVNDCMKRWLSSYQKIKLHKYNMVQGWYHILCNNVNTIHMLFVNKFFIACLLYNGAVMLCK